MEISLMKAQKTGGWTPGSYIKKGGLWKEDQIYLESGTLVAFPLAPVKVGDFFIVKCTGAKMPPKFGVLQAAYTAQYGYVPERFCSTGMSNFDPSRPVAEYGWAAPAIPVTGYKDYYKITVYRAAPGVQLVLYALKEEEVARLYSDAIYYNQMPFPKWLIPAVIIVAIAAVALKAIKKG